MSSLRPPFRSAPFRYVPLRSAPFQTPRSVAYAPHLHSVVSRLTNKTISESSLHLPTLSSRSRSPLLPQKNQPPCGTHLPLYKPTALAPLKKIKSLNPKMAQVHLSVLFLLLISSLFSLVLSATFTIGNNCDYTVWPGILSGAGTAPLDTTGFVLQKGESRSVTVPASWSGRLWGRTHCSTDPAGKFACATGDCGSSKLECSGSGATPPATLAEFTLNGSGGQDFYDVSLVDGYNLPILVVPQGGTGGNCSATGCVVDLNGLCPSDLKVVQSGSDVACRSACEAFGTEEYCCRGAYGNPNTCKPTSYSQLFKKACPRAYSYAYDDGTSTFTCANADYVITFCPAVPSQKSGKNDRELPIINESMVFMSGDEVSSNSVASRALGMMALSVLAVSWRLMHATLL